MAPSATKRPRPAALPPRGCHVGSRRGRIGEQDAPLSDLLGYIWAAEGACDTCLHGPAKDEHATLVPQSRAQRVTLYSVAAKRLPAVGERIELGAIQ